MARLARLLPVGQAVVFILVQQGLFGFCAERGLPYTEATLLGSYTQALRYLSTVGWSIPRRTVTTYPAAPEAPTGG